MVSCPDCGKQPGVFATTWSVTFTCAGCGARLQPRRPMLYTVSVMFVAGLLAGLAADAAKELVGYEIGVAVGVASFVTVFAATLAFGAVLHHRFGSVERVYANGRGRPAGLPVRGTSVRVLVGVALVLTILATLAFYLLQA